MSIYDYVIIGGGMAGGRTCESIRKVDGKGSIALVCGEAHRPYERPPLSKGYLVGRQGLDRVYLQPAEYYGDQGVELVLGVPATRLDPGGHEIELADGRALRFGTLCLAMGGSARRLPLPGADLDGVITLRTIQDCDSIRAAATAGQKALVVGGSFIGCEAAASLCQLGLHVTMVFPEGRMLERLAPASLSDYVRAMYESQGIVVRAKSRPVAFQGQGKVSGVELADGSTIDTDLVVLGVGIRLNTELARSAGLAVGERGEVIVDEFLRSTAPDIYAAGDIASWPDPTYGRRLRVEHWDVARRQGLRVGRAMAGDAQPYVSVPYFFSDMFDLSFEVWGDLDQWDDVVVRGSIESGSFAMFYFGEGVLTGVLAAARPDAERKPIQSLVKARPALEGIAERVANEAVDLSEI